jgi:hypothetical protein
MPGFEQLKEALANPQHPEYTTMKEWAGEDYDPYHFDARAARNAVMLAWAWDALDT